MSAFETFDCAVCGRSFKAHADGNAAAGPYCSPACESSAKGLS